MRKTHLIVLVYVAVAVGAAGCAQPSTKQATTTTTVAALAAKYGVSSSLLEVALRAGYAPETDDGKTVFCRHDEQTGSLVPARSCEDAARLEIDLRAREQFVEDVHQRVQQTPDTQRPGAAAGPH